MKQIIIHDNSRLCFSYLQELTFLIPIGRIKGVLMGAKYAPLPLLSFLHHPKTVQGIKLKLSDFKDTPLRHLLQVKPVRYILSCCHGNKITNGTSQNFAPKKSEKSAICKDIELKFGTETKFGPLSSENINLQFDVILTFSAFRPFR